MTWKEDGTLMDAYAGLYNTQTGAGTSRDKSLNFQINSEALTLSRQECETLFKTSGLVQKIVALLPEDSPIEWYSINLGSDKTAPQDISNYLEDKLSLHEKLVEASVLSRLHGNSYIVIFANDGRSSDQPIDEDELEEITDLKVLSTYEMRPSVYGSMTGGKTIGSLIQPEYYDLIGVTEVNKRLPESEQIPISQWRIHRSRVLSFSGRKLYNWMLYNNQGYDLSVLQSVVIAFSSYMQGTLASSGMIQDYSVFTYKLKGLAELILKGQSDAIIKRFLAIQMGMSYNKGLAMDADTEDAGYVQRQYGGVGDICDRLKTLLTAETGIPHTKLWGESSGKGSNAGQTEKADYAAAQESFQRHNWLKPTRELIRLTMISKKGATKGKTPEGWKITTRSALRLDLEEEANLRQKQARTDQIYRMLGVLHPLEIRKNRFGSPDYSMDTILDPDIDKFLWKHKDDAEFTLPVLASKLTGWSSDQPQQQDIGTGENFGSAHAGTDLGSKMGQAAIAGTGGDGGNNAQMQAEESDRDRMSENRRMDGTAVKRRFKWQDSTLAIEHLPGDIRHGRPMQGVYGYIQKHTGHDNEPLDFYGTPKFYEALSNGEQPNSKVFEIYQLQGNADDPVDRKSLDETKIILGAADKPEAMQTYLNHMPEHFLGGINELSASELRQYRYRRDSYREDIFNRSEARDANGRWTAGGGGGIPGEATGQKKEASPKGEKSVEGSWSRLAREQDRKLGIQVVFKTKEIAKSEQEATLKSSSALNEQKIAKIWGIDQKNEIDKLSDKMDEFSEKWEAKHPEDPFGVYDHPDYEKLSNKIDRINARFDRDPQRSRKQAFSDNYDRFKEDKSLNIEPIHAAVINDYMRNGHREINASLRSPETFRSRPSLLAAQRQAKVLEHSLQYTPTYKGEVHRGTDVKATAHFEKLKVGDVFADNGFMSTNRTDRGATKWDAPIELVIKSKTGKSIKDYGDHRYTNENKKEDEVLFLPKTPFKVTKRENQGKKLVLHLSEV